MIFALMIFQQACYDAGKRQRAAIKRMRQDGFAGSILEPDLHTIRLKGFKIAHRADFQPFFLRRAVYLEIVCHRGRKTHIAAA